MNTNYAGFWMRLVAFIIDAIIIGILQSFVFVPILGVLGISIFNSTPDMSDPDQVAGMVATIVAAMGTVWILAMIIQILYFTFMESSKYQATVGKLALGIIVTDVNGAKLDFTQALVRNLCRIISNITMLIGYIIAGFTEKKCP